ncbi:MAG: hypothetical protein PHP30_03470 [Bacteroidales bacterium]|nr:hypothetical protein [Bacteroidales bacterium]MDD2424641.1 hypothetical protein [Bacteroidales bacterium]MDD3989139.1 hypothetical protein [Bacteroidales bacterium]
MKKKFFFSIFTLLILTSLNLITAQNRESGFSGNFLKWKGSAGISYSFGSAELYADKDLIGGPTYSGRGSNRFSLWMVAGMSKKTDFQISASYTGNRFQITPAYTGGTVTSTSGNISVFSLSAFARYHFLKYLYLGAGPVLSMNTGDRDLNGIGAGAIFGGEYTFSNKIVISFGPYAYLHGLLPNKTYKLLNAGVNFSIGYKL